MLWYQTIKTAFGVHPQKSITRVCYNRKGSAITRGDSVRLDLDSSSPATLDFLFDSPNSCWAGVTQVNTAANEKRGVTLIAMENIAVDQRGVFMLAGIVELANVFSSQSVGASLKGAVLAATFGTDHLRINVAVNVMGRGLTLADHPAGSANVLIPILFDGTGASIGTS